jgi:DNA recombination protein RmuC
VGRLAGKAYWQALSGSPEFVVLFVPAEAFLSHALEVDAGLLEEAAAHKVILATPTTLIALLRTVAHAWTQEALADSARDVHLLGRELHSRISAVADRFDQLGRSLGASVGHYNKAMASLETRVLVSARRLGDLTAGDADIRAPTSVDLPVRAATAAELLVTDDVAPRRQRDRDADSGKHGRAAGA